MLASPVLPDLNFAIFMKGEDGREIYSKENRREYFENIATYLLEKEPPFLGEVLKLPRVAKAKEILVDCSSQTYEVASVAMKAIQKSYVDLLLCTEGDFVVRTVGEKKAQVGVEVQQHIEKALEGTSLISEGSILEKDKVAASFCLLSFEDTDPIEKDWVEVSEEKEEF